VCRGGIHLLCLFLPLLLSGPDSAVLLLCLFAGFNRGLSLLPFVVIALSGLPLWVGALGLDIGELRHFHQAQSKMVQAMGMLSEHAVLNNFESESGNGLHLKEHLSNVLVLAQ